MNRILLTIIAVLVIAAAAVWIFRPGWIFETEKEEASPQFSVQAIHQTDEFYDIHVEYPQFKGIDSLNAEISGIVEEKISNFKKESQGNWQARLETSDMDNPVPETPEAPFSFIAEWEPVQLNSEYISFVLRLYYYTGGAHGLNEVHAFNYSLTERKEIGIMDFLGNSQPALEKLSELAQGQVTVQLQSEGMETDDFLKEMIENGTEPVEENYRNFNFDYNSLTIYFQQYQVAPGAAGQITVTLYKSQLESNSIESEYLK